MPHDPATTILPYAADLPAGDGVQWRGVGPGRSALLVPPPPLWRLLAWPVTKLVLLMPFVVFAILWAVGSLVSGQVMLLGLTAVIATVGVAAWLGTFVRVIAIARHGRKPFGIEVEHDPSTAMPTDVRVCPPPWDIGRDDVSDDFSGRHTTGVRVEPMSPGLFYGTIRVYLAFADGTAISADIPCQRDECSQPIEEQLRHVLLANAKRAAPAPGAADASSMTR
jgi:hypothetical protein